MTCQPTTLVLPIHTGAPSTWVVCGLYVRLLHVICWYALHCTMFVPITMHLQPTGMLQPDWLVLHLLPTGVHGHSRLDWCHRCSSSSVSRLLQQQPRQRSILTASSRIIVQPGIIADCDSSSRIGCIKHKTFAWQEVSLQTGIGT